MLALASMRVIVKSAMWSGQERKVIKTDVLIMGAGEEEWL